MYNSWMSVNPPPFDFNHEVVRIRRDFPAETKSITFVDLAAPGARKEIRRWLYPPYDGRRLNKTGERLVQEFVKNRNCAKRLADGRAIVVIDSRASDQDCYFSLYHETGHMIVKDGAVGNISEKSKEDRADTFALLYGIHNGTLSTQHAVRLSRNRLALALALDNAASHFTSEAVDCIASLDPAALSPAEIATTAEVLARKSGRTARELKTIAAVRNICIRTHKKELEPVFSWLSGQSRDPYATLIANPAVRGLLQKQFEKAGTGKPGSLQAYISRKLSNPGVVCHV